MLQNDKNIYFWSVLFVIPLPCTLRWGWINHLCLVNSIMAQCHGIISFKVSFKELRYPRHASCFFSKSWICDNIMLLTTLGWFVRLVLCVMPLRWSVSLLMDWLFDASYTWSTSCCTLAWMQPLKYVSWREKCKYRIDDCHIVCGCTQGYLQWQWIYRGFPQKMLACGQWWMCVRKWESLNINR